MINHSFTKIIHQGNQLSQGNVEPPPLLQPFTKTLEVLVVSVTLLLELLLELVLAQHQRCNQRSCRRRRCRVSSG